MTNIKCYNDVDLFQLNNKGLCLSIWTYQYRDLASLFQSYSVYFYSLLYSQVVVSITTIPKVVTMVLLEPSTHCGHLFSVMVQAIKMIVCSGPTCGLLAL